MSSFDTKAILISPFSLWGCETKQVETGQISTVKIHIIQLDLELRLLTSSFLSLHGGI